MNIMLGKFSCLKCQLGNEWAQRLYKMNNATSSLNIFLSFLCNSVLIVACVVLEIP